jgi:4-amino-4-deoxy-L-arabinose transferase-like glycosyltransferase
MYVSVGLGVLTKGPVAAVVPALVFFVYLAGHRELSRVREMMSPTGIVVVLAIVAPWYIALYVQHGWTYIQEFFITENLGRYTETVGVQTRSPFFYLPVLFHDALPWSLFLPAVLAAWMQARRADAGTAHRLRGLLLLWIAVTVLFFSFSQTKQDLYIFSIVAAVAALGGDFVARAFDGARTDTRWLTPTLAVLAVVLVGLGALVLYFFAVLDIYRFDGAALEGTLVIAGGVLMLALLARGRRAAAAVAALAVCVAFNWILVLRVLPSVERYKPVVPLSEVIRRQATPADAVAHFDVALPSMVFYLRRHIDVWIDVEMFASQIRSQRRVFAVLPADRYPRLRTEFGVPTCELARFPTSDIRLRSLLRRSPPPEIILITNRCAP